MPRRKPTADPTRAVAYVRCSTDRQDLGLDAQRAAVEAWARARGVTVVATLEDAGVSGGAPVERCPGLLAAVAALAEHGAGVLVVAKRDRLARDVVKAAIVESLAEKVGAQVLSSDGVGNGDDPAAKLMRQMMAAFGAFERAQIGLRIRAALEVKKRRGERVGSVPFGMRLAADGRTLVAEPREQAAIAIARELRGQGLALRAIAERLAAAGHAPRRGRWQPEQVRRMVG